jgi:WD40 repeat protein
MTTVSRFGLLVAVFALSLSTARADDPLPEGSKLRLGSNRLTSRFSPVTALLPPDYRALLVYETERGYRRFDLATGKPLNDWQGGGTFSGSVVVSGNGRRSVVGNTNMVTVRDTETGKAIQTLKPPVGFSTLISSAAPSVSLSGDGKLLAQGGSERNGKSTVLIWDVDKNERVAEFTVDQRGGMFPVLSFDGKLLATRGASTTSPPGAKEDDARAIRVWDVEAKKELFLARPSPDTHEIAACSFSPDRALLAAGCANGPIDLWDVKTGKLKATLLGRTGQGHRIAFSIDGRTLATAAADGTIQRWSTETGKSLGATELPGAVPFIAVHGLAFADKDRVLAWGRVGHVAVVWEAPSGKLLTDLSEHTQAIKSIAFADGGKQIVTSGMDGKLVK